MPAVLPTDETAADLSPTGSPDDAARWEAVLQRRLGDEPFLYAVRTTGVFCLPTCPSRRPRRHNVEFFPTPVAARAAGYRPCRRCRPEVAPVAVPDLVARIQGELDAPDPPVTLAELARRVGRSPAHLQRTYRRHTGLTPRQYLASRRLAAARRGLAEGRRVVDAAFGAGYGSTRAFYQDAPALGLAPAVLRAGGAGADLRWTATSTPVGWAVVVASGRGLVALRLGDDVEALLDEVRHDLPRAALTRDDDALDDVAAAVRDWFDGDDRLAGWDLDVAATAFQLAVWEAARTIPRGERWSYTRLAEAVGRPSSVRAVARALATNPVGLAVPCHRVVRADGSLSGYRWGVERKAALLAAEAAHDAVSDPPPEAPPPG